MAICDGCGNNMIFPNKILGYKLCMKCGKALKVNSWKNHDFETNDEVLNMKKDVIFSANKSGIAENVIQEVSQYLDSKIEEGLIYKFNGD